MVKTIIKTSLVLLAAVSCSDGYSFAWQKFPMDGHRTGVTAAVDDNVNEAMGSVSESVYYAPNGKEYDGEATVAVAETMLEAQQPMAHVKKVIGYSPELMTNERPQSKLSNWAVDAMLAQTAVLTGVKADVGILNFGGIRVDMPKGNVLYDDLASMFPFKNYISLVKLRGSDLENIFKFFARRSPQVIGGDVKFAVEDGKIAELLVGGAPIKRNKVYTVATVDFLLDGGDSLFIAKNAVDLKVTDVILFDLLYDYVQRNTAEGKPIEAELDDRISVK